MRNLYASLAIAMWCCCAYAQSAGDIHTVITASASGWTKVCYVGSPQCSKGVGRNRPLRTPAMAVGLSDPTAPAGTANAVAHFQMLVAESDGYTEVLYVNTIGNADQVLYFTRDFYERFLPPPGITNLEWDTYQFAQPDGLDIMLGTQCNGQDQRIQYDNQAHGWVDTKVKCSMMMDGRWHHVHQTFHRDASNSTSCSHRPCEHWDTIQIDDGKVVKLKAKLPATRTDWHAFGAQWQIDAKPANASTYAPAIYDLFVDSDTVTASAAAQ